MHLADLVYSVYFHCSCCLCDFGSHVPRLADEKAGKPGDETDFGVSVIHVYACFNKYVPKVMIAGGLYNTVS